MFEQPKLKVESVKIGDLVPYEKNAKKHPEEQVKTIERSMEEFGNCDPISAWHDADGRIIIVEGHGRLMAMRGLGAPDDLEVPVIFLDHLTDAQRRAYTLAHNKTNMNSSWDYDLLLTELDSLADEFDFESFGFEEANIDWDAGVEDLDEKRYEPPKHKMLRCPMCGGVDFDMHFKQVEGGELTAGAGRPDEDIS